MINVKYVSILLGISQIAEGFVTGRNSVLIKAGESSLIETIGGSLFDIIVRNESNLGIFAGQLPPIVDKEKIDDPKTIPAGVKDVCVVIPPDDHVLYGSFELISNWELTGLDNITDIFTYDNGIQMGITWDLKVDQLKFMGTYDMNLVYNNYSESSRSIKGSGMIDATFNGATVALTGLADAPITGGMKMLNVAVTIGLQFVDIVATGGTIDDEPLDWNEVGVSLQKSFVDYWNQEENNKVVADQFKCYLDYLIESCGVLQWDSGNFECLNKDGNHGCFENPELYINRENNPLCISSTTEPTVPTDATGEPTMPTDTTGEPTTEEPTDTTGPTTIDSTTTQSTTPVTTTNGAETTTISPELLTCANREDGSYGHPYECEKYLVCTRGVAEVLTCPFPQLFNARSLVCDSPNNVNCDISCDGKHDGMYEHPQDCSLFIGCSGGHMDVLICPPPLRFDPTLIVCNFPENVTCHLD